MPKISRMRLVTVGYKDARFHDLILDFTDPKTGNATDSIVWLRNGGGKTSILNLTFSIPRPNLREFLGRKQEGQPRKLSDYVLGHDIATIIIEWELEGQATLGGRPRYITGELLERTSSSNDDDTLKRLFFAGRSVASKPGTTLETIPLWIERQDGKAARRSISLFRETWNDLADTHSSLGLVTVDTQTEWEAILDQANIDPAVYTYQVRMNQTEGGADDVFRFSTHEQFIDFLLDVALPTETADKTIRNVSTFRRELKQRNLEWMPDRELTLGLRDRVVPLVEVAKERATLQDRIATVERDLSHLLDHTSSRLGSAETAAKKTQSELERAQKANTDAREEHEQLEQKTAILDRHVFQLKLRSAQDDAKKAEDQAKLALRERRLWAAAIPAAKKRVHEATRKTMLNDLARRKTEKTHVVDALGETAASLRLTLKLAADEADTWVEEAKRQRDAHLAEAKRARIYLAELAGEDSRLTSDIKQVAKELEKAERERARLERAETLLVGEAGSEAVARLNEELRSLSTRAESIRKAQATLREQWPGLRAQLLEHGRLANEAAQLHKEIQGQLRTHAELKRRIENDALLVAALQVDRVELDPMLDAARRAIERDHRRTIDMLLRKKLERAEDERALPNLQKHALLPPTKDAAELLDRLERRFTGVWSGWHYLSKNRATPEEVRRSVRETPHFALGIVVNDRDHDAALALLHEGPAPEYPVAVFRESEIVREINTPGMTVIGPASDALFDTDAGERELDRRQKRLADSTRELEALDTNEAAYRDVVEALRQYAKHYSAEWFDERSASLTKAHAATQHHKKEGERLAEELGKSEAADNEHARSLAEAAERARKANVALSQLETFVRDHELPDGERRVTLRAKQDEKQGVVRLIDEENTKAIEAERAAAELATDISAKERDAASLRLEWSQIKWHELTKVEPTRGSLAELRPAYTHRLAAYEREFQESLVHQLADAEQNSAIAEERKFRKLLREDVTEKDVEKALDGLSDLALADARAFEAGELHNQLSMRSASLSAKIDPLKAALTEAESKCTRLGASLAILGAAPPPEIPNAEARLLELKGRISGLDEELPKLQRTENDARKHFEEARAHAAASRRHVETIGDIARSYNDVVPQITPARSPDWSPPEDPEIGTRLHAHRTALGEYRDETRLLNERRTEVTQRLRALASTEKYRNLNNRIAVAFLNIPDQDLELQAEDFHQKLETRLINLTDQIDSVESNRNTLIELTLTVADEAIDLVKRAGNKSRMPEGIPAFAGIPFLKIHYEQPATPDERRARAAQLVDETVNANDLPNGIAYAQSAARKLTHNIRVEVLFPDTAAPIQYLQIPQTAAKSGGERLTMAVVLFCLLVRLRGEERQRSSTPFLLDNPVGKANLKRFIVVQREVARATGVQLLYTTGVNDLEALEVFDNIVRLRNARRDKRTGQQHIEFDPEPIDGARLSFEDPENE